MREWLMTNWLRLKTLFRRKQFEQDLEDEFAFHFAQRGETPETKKEFGNRTFWKEQTRELWTFPAVETFLQDVRYGIRQLGRQRGSSVVAVLTLALGIGACTAIFSVIDAAMLRPLPFPDPEQLVTVGAEVIQADGRSHRPTASMDDMRLWQTASDVFSHVAGWGNAFCGRIVEGPEPERIRVLQFTESYLSMHGVAPILGRDFNFDDTQVQSPSVALLSHAYWQSRYGGRQDIIGESIRLDDGVATIVGVLPAWFDAEIPVFRPLRIPLEEASRRGTGRVSVYGRLRPGVAIEQARQRLTTRTAAAPSTDASAKEVRATVESRLEEAVTSYQTTVNVLAGAVGMVLFLACVNVAGLLLARGAVRQSELAVRASLGAGPGRLIRQLLAESFVLALAGGVVGVLLAWLALDTIVANIPMSMPDNSPVRVNPRVLGATAALLVPTVVLFGLVPAIRLSRVSLSPALVHSGRRVGSSLSRRGSQLLIAAEMALAVILVAGAGLMIRTLARLSAVDLGFNPEGLVTMEVLPLSQDPSVHKPYYPALLRQLGSLPWVASVGAVDNFPLGVATSYTSVKVEGESGPVAVFGVLPGYFETVGVALRDGRLLTVHDYAAGLRGAVINESAERSLFGGGPAVGSQFALAGEPELWTVLGVVPDVKHGGPLSERGLGASQVYVPFEPNEWNITRAMTVVLRPKGRPPGLAVDLRGAAQSIGPRVMVERVRSADEWFGDRVVTPQRRTILLSLLGGLALVVALVGVFGMTAYSVARRTSEIGVRMAFGSAQGQVVRKMLWDSAVPIVIGTLVGLGGAAATTQVMQGFLFETAPTDPLTFAAVALTLIVAGCLAAWIPARRAAQVDPVLALRSE